MDVQAPKGRRIQNRLRQDQAVGDDNSQISAQCGKLDLRTSIAQRNRMPNWQPQILRRRLHGAGPVRLAAPRRAGRLAVNRDDFVLQSKCLKDRNREIGRSHEDDFHLTRRSLSDLAINIFRFNGDR